MLKFQSHIQNNNNKKVLLATEIRQRLYYCDDYIFLIILFVTIVKVILIFLFNIVRIQYMSFFFHIFLFVLIYLKVYICIIIHLVNVPNCCVYLLSENFGTIYL